MQAQTLLLALLVAVATAQEWSQPSSCPPCDYQSCSIPANCEAGIVRDKCGCCDVCGKKEFEKCDLKHAYAHTFGQCGDNLECKQRGDVREVEALCFCTLPGGVVCGSDGVTYENLCQLAGASARTSTKITVYSKGVCKKAPIMVSNPEHVKDRAGTNIAIVCEAEGYPIPSVEWTWTTVDGETVFLPSDDLKVSVNMRGGPERSQVTGWLQIMDVEKKHEGDYTCIAQNELGVVQGTARINVIEDEAAYAKKKRRQDRPFGANDL